MAKPPVCKLMDFGKFKYEAAIEGAGSPQEPGQHGHQGDQAPAEDRPARLRHQEGPRRAVPQGRRQGQGDDHVPRARAVPPGARLPAPAAAGRGHRRAGLRREQPQAGRPQHDHGARTDEEEGRGQGRGEGRAPPSRRGCPAGRRRGRQRSGRRRGACPAGRCACPQAAAPAPQAAAPAPQAAAPAAPGCARAAGCCARAAGRRARAAGCRPAPQAACTAPRPAPAPGGARVRHGRLVRRPRLRGHHSAPSRPPAPPDLSSTTERPKEIGLPCRR